MKKFLSVLLALAMVLGIGLCGMVGAGAAGLLPDLNDLNTPKTAAAFEIYVPLTAYILPFHVWGASEEEGFYKEICESLLLKEWQERYYPVEADGYTAPIQADPGSIVAGDRFPANWEDYPFHIVNMTRIVAFRLRIALDDAIRDKFINKYYQFGFDMLEQMFVDGTLHAFVAQADAKAQALYKEYFSNSFVNQFEKFRAALTKAMLTALQFNYVDYCTAFIKNIDAIQKECEDLEKWADDNGVLPININPLHTFEELTYGSQEFTKKAQAILGKIEWIDMGWTPEMIAQLKEYFAENYDTIVGMLDELGFDTSVLAPGSTPPPNNTPATTPAQTWWQKAPAWIQWILRYVCFGWLWMK